MDRHGAATGLAGPTGPRWLEVVRRWWTMVGPTALAGALVAAGSITLLQALAQLPDAGAGMMLPPVPVDPESLAWTGRRQDPSLAMVATLHQFLDLLRVIAQVTLAGTLGAVLLLAAARSRALREAIGIHRAMGASRGHLARMLTVPTILLGLLLALLSMGTARGLNRWILTAWPGTMSGSGTWSALAPVVAVAALTLGALLPLRGARRKGPVLEGTNPPSLWIPAVQVALAVAVLLAAAGLRDTRAALGREAPGARSVRVPDGPMRIQTGHLTPGDRSAFYQRFLMELAAGGSRPSLSSPGTRVGLGVVDQVTTDCGVCQASTIIVRWRDLRARHFFVSPDTFQAFGQMVRAGRDFALSDDGDAQPVAIVNRTLAARWFQNGDAVGRDLYLGIGWPDTPYRVIGIVDELHPEDRAVAMGLQPPEAVYLSLLQHPTATADLFPIGLQSTTPAAAGVMLDPVPDPVAVERSVRRWAGRWMSAAGAAAVPMAGLGLLVAFWMFGAALRTELGIRRALGAPRLRLTLSLAARLAGGAVGGVLLGGFVYLSGLRPALTTVLGRTPESDWTLAAGLAGAIALLALSAGMAASWPALRQPPADHLP